MDAALFNRGQWAARSIADLADLGKTILECFRGHTPTMLDNSGDH